MSIQNTEEKSKKKSKKKGSSKLNALIISLFILTGVFIGALFLPQEAPSVNNSDETYETMNNPEYWKARIKLGLVENSEPRKPEPIDIPTGLKYESKERVYDIYHSYSIKHGDYGKLFVGL